MQPHDIVWDERVYSRVSPGEQYLYGLPFFAEIFNALDAHWKPPRNHTGWRISDCNSLNDLFVVYHTRSKSGLKRHFAQHPHWLPLYSEEEDGEDTGNAIELHRVLTLDFIGHIRVWLDNGDKYRLSDLSRVVARDPLDFAPVLALTPFKRHIYNDGEEEQDETDEHKESKLKSDERVRAEEAVLERAANDLHDQLAVYNEATRNLRNALAVSPLTLTDNECCKETRDGMVALYEELGHIEDQIEHIARCQTRFCKFIRQ